MVKKNNSNEINKDSLDLKSHLDASFDYDNIKVSEELINKTLEAIKNSNNKEELKEDNRKVTPFKKKSNKWVSTRRVAAAAAVLILFVAGYRVIDGGLGGKKSDQNSTMESARDEMNIFHKVEGDTGATMDSATTESAAESLEGDLNIQGSAEEDMNIMEYDKLEENSLTMLASSTFSSMYAVNPEQVVELAIESKDGSIKKPTNVQEAAAEVIKLIDEHSLTVSNEINSQWSIKISVISDTDSLTIYIGEGIQVQMGEDTSLVSYTTEDVEQLNIKLEEYFNSIP